MMQQNQMEKSKKDESKVKKKIRRCLSILERDYKVFPSDVPTQFIFVGNAGLTTGADEASLVQVFNNAVINDNSSTKPDRKYSYLESITLVPGKQYSFATFTSAQKAQEIHEAVHGKIGLDSSENPLYMAFVDQIPSVSSTTEYKLPPGLKVIEEFISEEDEQQLLNLIDWQCTPQDKTQGSLLKHRQVRHFGFEFKYGSNCVNKEEPLKEQIPDVLNPILEKITSQKIMGHTPDQCTVNRYLPGQGIPPHVDTHSSFTDEILSLSLGSAVIMDFREVAEDGRHYAVYLPSRSLCIMSGPARYVWSHGICPRMTDVVPGTIQGSGLHLYPRKERVSFTFRKIRIGECSCEHPKVCDSFIRKQQADNNEGLEIQSAWELEQQHVQQVYDQIAPHFSQTRHKPWPRVLEFVCSLPCGSQLLDIGCGNGKYLGHNKSILQVGCDSSVELLKICQDRGHEVFAANCLSLPYRDAVVDAVISIAVIHHLCTKERRRASLSEMHRVLRVGGRGLVYVWAVEQNRGNKLSAYLKQNKNNRVDRRNKIKDERNEEESTRREIISEETDNSKLPSSLPIHKNRTDFIQQDMLVPWKLKPQNNAKQNKDKKGTKNEKLNNKMDMNEKNEKSSNISQINNAEIISNSLENSCVIKETTSDNKMDSELDLEKNERTVSPETKCNEKENSGLGINSSSNSSIPVFNRYYHVFCEGELQSLCEEVEGLKVVEIYYDEGNWCCIFEKIV